MSGWDHIYKSLLINSLIGSRAVRGRGAGAERAIVGTLLVP